MLSSAELTHELHIATAYLVRETMGFTVCALTPTNRRLHTQAFKMQEAGRRAAAHGTVWGWCCPKQVMMFLASVYFYFYF
jgi:hypothetical protein